jgi:hypothetical protein
MMRTFMDDVALEPSAGGTTVRMSRIVRWVLPDLANRIARAAEKLDPCCMSGTT